VRSATHTSEYDAWLTHLLFERLRRYLREPKR
jgi:hypothetical protein